LTDQTTGSSETGADLDAALNRLEQKVNGGGRKGRSSGADVKRTGGLLIALLVSFVAMGVAGYAVYQFYLLDKSMAENATTVSGIEQTVQVLESELNSAAIDLQNLGDRQSTEVVRLEKRLNAILTEIRSLAGTRSQDWILAEVEYLLRLANQRVMMEKEVKGAIALLQSADTLIEQAEIVSAFPVRRAIAEDLATLKSLAHLDTEGTYLKLSAQIRQVDHLRRWQLEFRPDHRTEEVIQGDESAEDKSWDQDLVDASAAIGDKLFSLVNYREGVERVRPILPPEEEYYIRQNLKLKFEHAQLALLNGKQAAYDQSIADSIEWVGIHFDQDDSVTEAMKSALMELANAKVEQAMPDISGSLTEIRKYLAEFHLVPDKSSQQQE
jgi:uroporphyrin-3 C-methyltransferase